MAWMYIRDGEGTIPVEPGEYTVVVARGPTHEAHVESVSVVPGEARQITATLDASVDTDGFWSLDPHSHAAPSGDGSIPMSGDLEADTVAWIRERSMSAWIKRGAMPCS